MSQELTIRKAVIEDLEQLTYLFDGYRLFYKKQSNIQGAKEFLSERIKIKDSVIIVAQLSNKILAGFVQLYPIFSSTRMKKLWLLNDLFVHEDHRGNKVSKSLIEGAKMISNATHAAGLILETEKNNKTANNLYVNTGFELDQDHNYYSWEPK